MIEIKNISSGYGKTGILKDLSFSLEKGKITVIIGPNGCGKSTLLKTASGLLSSKGEILIDHVALTSLERRNIAKKIAYLPQGKNTPDMTVEQLVLHGRFPHIGYPRHYSDTDREIAKKAMKTMGISQLAKRKVGSLSGGMQQSVYIAMALCQGTDYIFLDEPTTYLDISNTLKLFDILKELSQKGKGILAVLHDINLALQLADRVAIMDKGKIVMCDTPEKLFVSGKIDEIFHINLKRTKTDEGFVYYY